MKRTLLTALLLATTAANAQPMSWTSAPVFIGQTETQHGIRGLGYVAQIASTTPDAQGNYEVWTFNVVQSQESFADHLAIQTRAQCNASGDNSCVLGVPGWQEVLIPTEIFVK